MTALADVATIDGSLPALVLADLIERHGIERTHEIIDETLAGLSVVELAAHDQDWRRLWARPKQVPPAHVWESCGHLQGRGSGKTVGLSHFVNDEVEEERARLVCLIAQDEDSSIKLHVTGPSGLIATSKPWFRPVWHASSLELHWPNGAIGYVRTPEVPRKIRGLEYDLAWASELQSWPDATMHEAWMNVLISTRLGLARVVWDATAKRRHELLLQLIKEAETDPLKHVLVRGSTYENALNLGRGYIEKIERKYGGTRQGEEELFARVFDDVEGATVEQKWIDKARRPPPARFLRRAVSIDPAITSRGGSDITGIVVGGLGVDGQGYVLKDRSGKYRPLEWAEIVLDEYFENRCDCVVVETNKGGDLLGSVLSAAALNRGVDVVTLGKTEKPKHLPGVVYIREVYARGEKADRAKPLGTAYERGSISHVGTFDELERLLTTWIPSPGSRSPDRLDATVHLMVELLELSASEVPLDTKKAFAGAVEINEKLMRPPAPAPSRAKVSVAALLAGRSRGGGRI